MKDVIVLRQFTHSLHNCRGTLSVFNRNSVHDLITGTFYLLNSPNHPL